jgi:GT2 family glycosyltransferase
VPSATCHLDAAGAVGVLIVDADASRAMLAVGPCPSWRQVRVRLRVHDVVVGEVDLRLGHEGLASEEVTEQVWASLAGAVETHLRRDDLPPATALLPTEVTDDPPCSWPVRLGTRRPSATVVITACEVGRELAEVVRGALAQSYRPKEVLVVDNRPVTSGLQAWCEQMWASEPAVRYVAESSRGLSHARNAGLRASRSEITAFTDDDVKLDPNWLGQLVAGIVVHDASCATGLILPATIDTEARELFEQYGGYTKGFLPRVWTRDMDDAGPAHPFQVGAYGSGASAAFRTDDLRRFGGFAGTLGAGTRSRGGEDLDVLTRFVVAGHRIAYEPSSMLLHAGPADMSTLESKLFDYGVGLSAAVTHLLLTRGVGPKMLARAPAMLAHITRRASSKNVGKTGAYPARLTRRERSGMLVGPFAYLRERLWPAR